MKIKAADVKINTRNQRGTVMAKFSELLYELRKEKNLTQSELAEKLANQHMINAYDNMVKNGLKEIYGESSDEKNKEKVGWQKEQREIVS